MPWIFAADSPGHYGRVFPFTFYSHINACQINTFRCRHRNTENDLNGARDEATGSKTKDRKSAGLMFHARD